MYAKIRGTEIYFDVTGMQLVNTGKKLIENPVLFMLHGGPGSDHLAYKKHSLFLQQHAQLVFIDYRGCGRSKKTKASDYTLENNIEDIEALRQYLGLDNICLLGASYGGIVAQGYAIRYAKYVKKLMLIATAPSYRFIQEAQKNLLQYGNARQIAWSEHLWNGTFKNHQHVLQFFKHMSSLYSISKKGKSAWRKSNTIWSYQALNQGFKFCLREYNFVSQLKKIKCPTLVLAGEHDWICSPEQAKIIAQHIPHAQLKIFKHCAHAVATDAHNGYMRAVKKFFTSKI